MALFLLIEHGLLQVRNQLKHQCLKLTACLAQNLIRINECTKEQLKSNSEIGEGIASQVIEQRDEHKFFKDWKNLKEAVPKFPDSKKELVFF